jgi:chromosome segregation ATPase
MKETSPRTDHALWRYYRQQQNNERCELRQKQKHTRISDLKQRIASLAEAKDILRQRISSLDDRIRVLESESSV